MLILVFSFSFFRYKEGGEALLILLPSEEQRMIQQLLLKKVPVKEIK
jgi:ATP-dependent RNA helicase DDX10/DBP4